jgi:hypothetical protein
MMMTGVRGSTFLIRRRTSMPSRPGMSRSRRTTSKDGDGNFSRASSPDEESSTS